MISLSPRPSRLPRNARASSSPFYARFDNESCVVQVVLTDLGTRHKDEGRLETAIAFYERAASICPQHADALYNLGVAHSESGNAHRAAIFYHMTVALQPGAAEAWNNLGVISKAYDTLEQSIECFMVRTTIGISRFVHACAVQACAHAQELVYAAPQYFLPCGILRRRLRLTARAESVSRGSLSHPRTAALRAQRAVAARPQFAQPWNNLGIVYTLQARAPTPRSNAALRALPYPSQLLRQASRSRTSIQRKTIVKIDSTLMAGPSWFRIVDALLRCFSAPPAGPGRCGPGGPAAGSPGEP